MRTESILTIFTDSIAMNRFTAIALFTLIAVTVCYEQCSYNEPFYHYVCYDGTCCKVGMTWYCKLANNKAVCDRLKEPEPPNYMEDKSKNINRPEQLDYMDDNDSQNVNRKIPRFIFVIASLGVSAVFAVIGIATHAICRRHRNQNIVPHQRLIA